MRDAVTTGGNALPKRDPARCNAFQGGGRQAVAGTPLAEAHGAAVPHGSGQRPHVRHLISTGYLSLESREAAAAVALAALELTLPATLLSRDMLIPIMCPTCRHIGATSAARLPRKLVCFVCNAACFRPAAAQLPARAIDRRRRCRAKESGQRNQAGLLSVATERIHSIARPLG